MMEHQKYDWNWFRTNMASCMEESEQTCLPLLKLFDQFDEAILKITNRDMAIDSERPQDYVVPLLAVRSFRLAVSAVSLALSGYLDSGPNLERTIFEIHMRLLDMSSDPAGASLAFLMQAQMEEISIVRIELDYRQAHCLHVHNLAINLRTMEQHLELLRGIAKKRGHDPQSLIDRYGKVNIHDVCRRFGIEKAYSVNYAFACGYVHEKNIASSQFSYDSYERRVFELGIVQEGIAAGVSDALIGLSAVLSSAARLLKDTLLIEKAQRLHDLTLKTVEAYIAKGYL
jgi:hypothetical protein